MHSTGVLLKTFWKVVEMAFQVSHLRREEYSWLSERDASLSQTLRAKEPERPEARGSLTAALLLLFAISLFKVQREPSAIY